MINTAGSTKELLRRLEVAVEKSAHHVWELRESGADSDVDASGPSGLTHVLGLTLAGAGPAELGSVSIDRIGYGSRVTLRDVQTDEVNALHLMNSGAMDVGAGHVSLESPFGQALLGHAAADVVDVHTPGGVRTFEVVEVRTLPELLAEVEPGPRERRHSAEDAPCV